MPKRKKPSRPHRGFPLFPHGNGQWAKKIHGRLVYFGPWSDANAALNKYLREYEARQLGVEPDRRDVVTVKQVCFEYLAWKEQQVRTHELQQRTFNSYVRSCKTMSTVLGHQTPAATLTPFHFMKLREAIVNGGKFGKRGPVAIKNEVRNCRMVWKFADDVDLIPRPIKFGSVFDPPSRKALREARNAQPARMFEAAEIRELLQLAKPPLKAMILLAINCGFGNTDISRLAPVHLHRKGWVDFPRPKTAVQRRCPLWPETAAAIPMAASSDLVFLTQQRQPWVHETESGAMRDNVSERFKKLVKKAGIDRPGSGFYALRHTFETIAGDSKDQIAVDFIMGHAPADDDMSEVYRERINDRRLQDVVRYVHRWLFEAQVSESATEGVG